MKYLYQQLLAFIGVIALIILIVGTSFTQLTKRTMQENNYEQLYGYAESALETRDFFINVAGVSDRDVLSYSFQLTERVLQKQDVQFVFINKDREVQYPPVDSTKKLDFSLIDKNWDQIMKGNRVYATENIDIYGARNISSYVMLPVYASNQSSDKKVIIGSLVITQPAKNVDRSVQSVTQNLIKGFIFSGVIALLLSYLFATFQVKRINRMRKATKEITSGNFDIQLPVHDKDEFDDLAEDFNKMAASLKESQEAFNRQAAVLTDDLKNVVTNERKKVYLNTFFKNSTVYANTSRNYPILSKIVPPNDGLYFPNYVWFNTSSNLGVEMAPLTDTDMSKNQKVVSNHFYDIYTNNKEIFVFMK